MCARVAGRGEVEEEEEVVGVAGEARGAWESLGGVVGGGGCAETTWRLGETVDSGIWILVEESCLE